LGPSGFYLLPAGPANAIHTTETKSLAVLAMPIDVPTWNSNLDEGCWVNLHVVCQVFHMMPEIFASLTTDIVCYDNPWEFHTRQCGENNVVHVAVPDVTH